MKLEECIMAIQAYYGEYKHPPVLSAVVRYIQDEIDQERIDALYAFLLRSHPVKFGPPDVAALETAVVYALDPKKQTGRAGRAIRKGDETKPWTPPEDLTPEERARGAALMHDIFAKLQSKSIANSSEA